MTNLDFKNQVDKMAKDEIEHEQLKIAIQKRKAELLKPWHLKLFPFKLTMKIERRKL